MIDRNRFENRDIQDDSSRLFKIVGKTRRWLTLLSLAVIFSGVFLVFSVVADPAEAWSATPMALILIAQGVVMALASARAKRVIEDRKPESLIDYLKKLRLLGILHFVTTVLGLLSSLLIRFAFPPA